MPRFHLNLKNSSVDATDEEGVEAADLDGARSQAIAGIRGFLSHEVINGILDLRGRIDIADSSGTMLMTVAFSDAVTVTQPQ